MSLNIDPSLYYRCVQCGRSCTGWNIWLDESLARQLKDLPITLRIIEERGQAFEQVEQGLKMYRNDMHPACGYLSEQKLCNIHATLGFQAKPRGCQQFPFLFTRLPDGQVQVGASYCCTAVRGEIGPPLSHSLGDIELIFAQAAQVREVPALIEIYCGYSQPYTAVVEFETYLEQRQQQAGWDIALTEALSALITPLIGPWSPLDNITRQMPALKQLLNFSLLKICLNDHCRQLWTQIDQAVMDGTTLHLPEFNWNASVQDLERTVQEKVGNRFDGLIDNYRRALWFRKEHLLMGDLLSGLLLLWSLPDILRILTVLQACKGGHQPEQDDFSQALDTAELSLVAHSQNGRLLMQKISQYLQSIATSQ